MESVCRGHEQGAERTLEGITLIIQFLFMIWAFSEIWHNEIPAPTCSAKCLEVNSGTVLHGVSRVAVAPVFAELTVSMEWELGGVGSFASLQPLVFGTHQALT